MAKVEIDKDKLDKLKDLKNKKLNDKTLIKK
jgi:hypothetical protein